ncbi:phage tail protein [Dickeya fangzhongdai]|uniref:phage tail protein n=1 Tax=Dickeya fangzhongdai TaxID=1778540 RepID=UPI001AD98CFB|nr:phage tail protein [Dickeya fangzhongdai]MBO8132460.1 phage tail protein [Dickeya fangzhongdai]
MSLSGLDQAINNLNSISKTAVPRATAQAVNRIAGRAISRSSRKVAQQTKVPNKLVRGRSRLKKATINRPIATIKVNRGNLPAIKLGAAKVQLSRRKGNRFGAGSVLKIGKFSFPGAFIQQLNNGRWHVMRRLAKARYPIEVVKIPLETPLTSAFREETMSLMDSDMPKELSAALKNQLRLVLIK